MQTEEREKGMEIQYRRNFNESYMIVEAPDEEVSYEERMIRRNEISFLLPFRKMEVNGKAQLWYDITGRESLRDRMRRQGVSAEGLMKVIECLDEAYREMGRYLLGQEHVSLCPDTIFFGHDGRICLCYCPAGQEDPFGQMREVMEFVLTLVEEDQEETAELCYRLYDITLQEHYSFFQMLECIRDFRGKLPEKAAEEAKREQAELPEKMEEISAKSDDIRQPTDEPDPLELFGKEYMEIPLMEERQEPSGKREGLMEVVKRAREEIASLRKVAAQIIAGEHLDFDGKERNGAASDSRMGEFACSRERDGEKKRAGD